MFEFSFWFNRNRHLIFGFFVAILLTQIYASCTCNNRKELSEKFAGEAASKLAKCCSKTGEYEVNHQVLKVAKERKKRLKIEMEITWREAKLLGAKQVLKGTLHVDSDGCNAKWEQQVGGLVTMFDDCWNKCLFDCLETE